MAAKTTEAQMSLLYDGVSSIWIPYHCAFKGTVFPLAVGTPLMGWRTFPDGFWQGVPVKTR